MPMPDLVLRAGRVVDGTGGPAVTADVAVRDGQIAEIGRVRDRAHRVIDADGALVLPGLVAILPPSTVAPFDRNALRHLAPGTTTTVETVPLDLAGGDAGAEYANHLRSEASVTNRFLLANHRAMRGFVMGNRIRDELDSSAGDQESMATLLSETLTAGARGILCDPASSASERLAILAGLGGRWSEPSAAKPIVVLLEPTAADPEEVLHEARRLLALRDDDPSLTCSVVVSFPEPLDDPEVATALRLAADATTKVIRVMLAGGRSIIGSGLNPLALVADHLVHEGDDDAPSLEELVQRIASAPQILGLTDRGRIESDMVGDLNIVDPAHLNADLTAGLISTLVGGNEIVSFDELTGEAPGQLL